MAANIIRKYRIEDLAVRPAESTTDYVVCECEGTLSGGTLTCNSPFKDGAHIGYVLVKKATTAASGTFTASNAAIGDTDTVTVLVFGHGYDLQSAFS